MKTRPNQIKILMADRLKEARKRAGLTQSQIAKLMSMHRPTIAEIEAGRRNVTAEELQQFSEFYSTDIRWLSGVVEDFQLQEEKKIQIAARELSNLKDDDLEKLMSILAALKESKPDD